MGGKTPKPKEPEISDEDKMFNSVFEFNMMAKNYRKESEKSAAAEKLAIKKVKIVIQLIQLMIKNFNRQQKKMIQRPQEQQLKMQ